MHMTFSDILKLLFIHAFFSKVKYFTVYLLRKFYNWNINKVLHKLNQLYVSKKYLILNLEK